MTIDELKLRAARYAYHKQMVKRYGDAVESGQMPVEQAREMYRLAMENYDGIIENATSGASEKANAEDMDKGFPL